MRRATGGWFRAAAPAALALGAAACTHGLFSGIHNPDRSRPVVAIETTGGRELGACTSEGILFLGRTAQEGPCRVHYFLGPQATPQIEDGVIAPFGSVFYLADIDLKTQAVPLLGRDPTAADDLVAVVHDRLDVRVVPVRLADHDGVEGDVLAWPARCCRPAPACSPAMRRAP